MGCRAGTTLTKRALQHAGQPPKAGRVSSSGTPSFAAAAATAGVRRVLIACLSKLFSPTPPVGSSGEDHLEGAMPRAAHVASWRFWTALGQGLEPSGGPDRPTQGCRHRGEVPLPSSCVAPGVQHTRQAAFERIHRQRRRRREQQQPRCRRGARRAGAGRRTRGQGQHLGHAQVDGRATSTSRASRLGFVTRPVSLYPYLRQHLAIETYLLTTTYLLTDWPGDRGR